MGEYAAEDKITIGLVSCNPNINKEEYEKVQNAIKHASEKGKCFIWLVVFQCRCHRNMHGNMVLCSWNDTKTECVITLMKIYCGRNWEIGLKNWWEVGTQK